MFWGLIMEPGKKYTQRVEQSFHVSQAALDTNTAGNDAVQVLLGFDNRNFLICTLQKQKTMQVPLDLNFQVGDQVSFATSGNGHVHLTGYLVDDDDDYMNDLDGEEVEEEEEVPTLVPAKLGKRKASEKLKKANTKRSKTEELLKEPADTDDSDDADVSLTDLMEAEAEEEESEDDDDEEAVEEEEDDDDDDDDDDEDEEDEESDDDEEEDETEVKKPTKKDLPKQNGVVSKKDKLKMKQKTEKTPEKQVSGKSKKEMKAEKLAKQNENKKSPGKSPSKHTAEGGVIIEDLKEGSGNVAKAGKIAHVFYEGRLKSNNKMFDSHQKGSGFRFRLGRSEVIRGWDVGIPGMKVGGKRRITIPPNMAYGAQGSPPTIPPNSTLVFEVELKSVN